MVRVPLVPVLALTLLGRPLAAQMEYAVYVDPDGAALGANPNSSGLSATFQVYTTSLFEETVPLSCGRTGQVTSCSVASSVVVPGNGEGPLEVQVTYATGSAGSGTLVLYATGGGLGDDQGSYNVTVSPPAPTITIVTPGNTVYTRTPVALVKYTNGFGTIDTSTLVVTWGGTSVKALGRYNDRLFEWEADGASHALTPGGMKQLYVYVCSLSGPCSSATRNVTLAASPRPILSLKPMPLEAHGRQFSSPFGPGIGVSGGGDIELGISTPAYFSFNSPRTAGLTYSSRQSLPRVLVNVDLEFPGAAPSSLTMRLKDGGATVDSAVFTSPSCSSGGAATCRVALQAEFYASSYPAVRKWLRVEAQATISGTPYTVYDSVEVVLVDRRTTPYGSGWWPSGVMRLVSSGDDAILVASDGNASVFRGAGSGAAYIAPPGQTSTLFKVGSTWELRFRGGGKVTFDSYGRQTAIVDINGNTESITYLSTDQVYRITDPKGKYFTFTYGNPNSTVSVITDPGGRQTTVTVNASRQLTTYVIAPGTRNYGGSFTWHSYTGSAVLPATRANVLGAADSIHYTGALRPYRVKLRTVQNEYGSNVQPTIQYYPQELKALHLLKSFSELYTEVIDPKGNWTRAELNRWGAAVQTWDTVGTIGKSTYDAAGRVLTAEGKVGDSTRVHYTYDARGRLVRTHKVLNGSGIFRLDSLVYDGSDRVIQRLDSENRVATTVYDGVGNVIRAIAPNGDTTHFWYGSYGQLDSTRGRTTTKATRFTYNTTWRNSGDVFAPSGELVERNYYDTYGRRESVSSKVTVQATSTTDKMQWRRRVFFYNAANQVDSAYSQRTNNCDAPCTSVPPWPSATDTVRTLVARTWFNALGLDTLRSVRDTIIREVFRYDALGRLVTHWPRGRIMRTGMSASDTNAVTFKYDIGGNLRYTVTRRGHTLESQFDTRNRLNRRVLGATVGTFDYAYGGPNDELTAITAQSGYADAVGSSTINAAWVYNQSGQLVRDTTQGNRVTTYAYSASLLRLTSLTDAIGTRGFWYDPTTGMMDSVSVPTDGGVYYNLVAGRLIGPYEDGTGQDFSRTQSWRGNSGLRAITNKQSSVDVGQWLATLYEENDTVTTKWIEKRGSGGAEVEMPDSVTYDGWERLLTMKHLQHDTLKASETFAFDRWGNLTIDASGAVFNVMDRLTSTNACSSHTYDVAGNLTAKTCNGKSWAFTYDALDRLTHVTYQGQALAYYTYDVLGNRIAKKVSGTVTRFVWRGGHVVYETDGNGTITISYTWGMGTDDLIAIHRHNDGAHRYVVQDKLRSVRGLVDRNGTWMASWRYRAYGTHLDSAGGDASAFRRFRWAGAQYDEETGFYFLRSRYYDPTIGRFVQEDKIGRAGGLNLYLYAGGAPLVARDPAGTMKNYDEQYGNQVAFNNCWDHFNCAFDGFDGRDTGGGGDWDGNGRGDAAESFGLYWDAGMTDVSGYEYDRWRAAHPNVRGMNDAERSVSGDACADVSCAKIRIVEYAGISWRPMAVGHTVYWPGKVDLTNNAHRFWLVHELWHVKQYEDRGWLWYGWFGLGALISGVFHNAYYVGSTTSTDIWSYGFEQQGQIAAGCVIDRYGKYCGISPWAR